MKGKGNVEVFMIFLTAKAAGIDSQQGSINGDPRMSFGMKIPSGNKRRISTNSRKGLTPYSADYEVVFE